MLNFSISFCTSRTDDVPCALPLSLIVPDCPCEVDMTTRVRRKAKHLDQMPPNMRRGFSGEHTLPWDAWRAWAWALYFFLFVDLSFLRYLVPFDFDSWKIEEAARNPARVPISTRTTLLYPDAPVPGVALCCTGIWNTHPRITAAAFEPLLVPIVSTTCS